MLRRTAIVVAIALVVAVGATVLLRPEPEGPHPGERLVADERVFGSDDPIERACGLADEELVRIWRGHRPGRSEELTVVPQEPNFWGSFTLTTHTGPWDYIQTVPLILYGPEHIRARGQIERAAGLADVYPTVGRLTEVDLPARDGRALGEALRDDAGAPKLIVNLLLDGVGRNVIEAWPGVMPTLEMMEREGTSYVDATVGSSPSITPATHATLGTGLYPKDHGITAIQIRRSDGSMRKAFQQRDPSDLLVSTYGDDVDLAYGNASKVGLIGWKSWHFGMFSRGAFHPGGDNDDLGLIGKGRITGKDEWYSTPDYFDEFPGLFERVEEVDLEDGEEDGMWLGNDMLEQHDSPAWVRWQTDAILALLEREGYGHDDVPDMFMANYKAPDLVGHNYGMGSEEMRSVLGALDTELRRILDHLEDTVEDFVVIITADHASTPFANESGAWPVHRGELVRDVDAHFEVPEGETLFDATSAVGSFFDQGLMREVGITIEDIARFLNSYSIRENWSEEELPAGYEHRGGEQVFAAAYPSRRLPDVMRCRFGSPAPPDDIEA